MQTRKTIGVIGAGQMGAGIGGLLAASGARVISPLARRSDQSRQRAASAGMEGCEYSDLHGADIVLSIVPPAESEQVAFDFAVAGTGRNRPLFVDANAVSPDSKRLIGGIIAANGGRFVDGAIIGAPPGERNVGPRVYVSGDHAGGTSVLRELGLDLRLIEGPVGTAAALKMCYGGFNKGIIALTTATMLAAQRVGVGDMLVEEVAQSHHSLLESSRNSVPRMYPKAYRWVAEFDEIAAFTDEDPSSAEIFSAIARFYEDRAVAARSGKELNGLMALLD